MGKSLICNLFFVLACKTVLGETFFGKLVLKTPSAENRHSVFEKSPVVFATRRSTYLKKNGDVFKIYIPAISKDAAANTISFESMRKPNFFLVKDLMDDNFHITRRDGTDPKLDNAATFMIERRAGIEGSGMLRVLAAPSKYLCIRRGANVTDSALQAIEKESTEDFKYRCSFYIQKLRDENVPAAIKKSMGGHKPPALAEKKPISLSNTTAINSLLQDFNKKVEHHQQALLSEAAEQQNQQAIEASQQAFQYLSTYGGITKNEIEKLPTKKVVQNVNPGSKKETFSLKPAQVQNANNYANQNIYQNYQQRSNAMYKLYNPYRNPYNSQYMNNLMLPFNPMGSQKSRVPVATISPSYAQKKMPVTAVKGQKTKPFLSKPTSKTHKAAVLPKKVKNLVKPIIANPYAKVVSKVPSKANANPYAKVIQKAPLQPLYHSHQNIHAKHMTSNAIHTPVTNRNTSKVIGPRKPINVHDFQMTHMHREPSLNIDGLMHSVTLPATRSGITSPKIISNSTTSNNITMFGDHIPDNNPNHENVFFNLKEVNDSRMDNVNSRHQSPLVAHKMNAKSNLTGNLISNETSGIENSTVSHEHPKPESSMVANATKYEKSNANSSNDTASVISNDKDSTVFKNETILENATAASAPDSNTNKTLNTTSSFMNLENSVKNSSSVSNTTIVANSTAITSGTNAALATDTKANVTTSLTTKNGTARKKIYLSQNKKRNLTMVNDDSEYNGNATDDASDDAQLDSSINVESNETDSGDRKSISVTGGLTDLSVKKNTSSGLVNTSTGVENPKNLTVGFNPNIEPKVMTNPLVNALHAEVNALKTTNPDETVGDNPNEMPDQKVPFELDQEKLSNEDALKTAKPDETVGSNPNDLPNQKIPFQIDDGDEENEGQSNSMEENMHLPLNKVSLLHRNTPNSHDGPQMAKNNASVSLDGALSMGEPNAIDDSLSYPTEEKENSPEEQDAMVMQGIRGAVQKIQQNDMKEFSKKINAIDLEDKNPQTKQMIADTLRYSNNPKIHSLLRGNFIPDKAPNDDGLSVVKSDLEQTIDDPLNSDERSRLPALRREHHAIGFQRNQLDDFHPHDLSLSQDDREHYNELSHNLASTDHHHYLNDDTMHPPITQDAKQENAMHHQYHGVVDDDPMSPPIHPNEFYHEFVHQGNFNLRDHPVALQATHHIFTGNSLADTLDGPFIGSPQGHPTTLYENDHYEPARANDDVTDQFLGRGNGLTDETNLQHHTHHVVTVKSEAEKQKMVHGLVDPTKDKCISLQIVNDVGRRYRLISSINKHGYTPRGKLFTLKTVFKDPNVHKLVLFKAVDEENPASELDIDGKSKFVAFPTSCQSEARLVHVVRPHQQPSVIGCGSSSTDEDCVAKKSLINAMKRRSKLAINDRLSSNHKRSDIEKPPEAGCIRAYHEKNPLSHSCCVFPFVFGGVQHNGCIKSGDKAWCGTTGNVDRDKKWGLCTPPNPVPEYNSVNQHAPPISCQPYCKIKCLPTCPNSCC